MYATCALPLNASMWCSQSAVSGMSFTMIISSKSAPATTDTIGVGIDSDAREDLLVHRGDATRRLLQPVTIGILADAFEDQADALLDLLAVDLGHR